MHSEPVIDEQLLGIGEVSRASGLTVSALRFYDRQGVLVPADVDGVTGYRRYHPAQVRQARLLAGMRRIQMPVAEMVSLLEALGGLSWTQDPPRHPGADTGLAEDLLDGHLARLERGLADARREVERLRGLVRDGNSSPRQLSLNAAALRQALSTVRYAVGTDPHFPVLTGVLLDRDEVGVRVVATDRYRLALAVIPGAPGCAPLQILLPAAVVDEVIAAGADDVVGASPAGVLSVYAGDGQVRVAGPDFTTHGAEPEGDYPDYRRILPQPETPASALPLSPLRRDLWEVEATHEVVRLDTTGLLIPPAAGDDPDRALGSFSLNRTFLWEALCSLEDGQVCLPIDGEIGPLVIRSADDTILSLVMPVHPTSAT